VYDWAELRQFRYLLTILELQDVLPCRGRVHTSQRNPEQDTIIIFFWPFDERVHLSGARDLHPCFSTMLHRLGGSPGQGPNDAVMSLEGQQGAGGGLRGCTSWVPLQLPAFASRVTLLQAFSISRVFSVSSRTATSGCCAAPIRG
jgi:hypothetical protein